MKKDENIRSAIVLCGGKSRRMGEDKGSMEFHKIPMIIHVLNALDNQIDEVILVLNDSHRIASYKSLIQEEEYVKNNKAMYGIDENNKKNEINKNIENGFGFNLIFVEDEIKDQGPLSGIQTGLKKISGDYAIILPCDSPFVSSDFIKHMFYLLDKNIDLEIDVDCITPYHMVFNTRLSQKIPIEKEIDENIEFKNIILDNSEPLHSIYKKSNHMIIEEIMNSNDNQVKTLIKNINSYFVPIDNKKIDESNFKNINSKKDLK